MSFRLLLVTAAVLAAANETNTDHFLVKPYLQLGDAGKLAAPERLTLLWHTADVDADFAVEVRSGSTWMRAERPAYTSVRVRTIEPHRVWRALLSPLAPGADFDYRVLKSGAPVFEARARARKSAAQPYRFAVFGDCGQNSVPQKAIAYQTSLAQPDFVFITGDIVYGRGRVSEYREKHFPVYNAEETSAAVGAGLLRSVLFIGAPGNHDIASIDLATYPDTLAYFYYWRQPLNGPVAAVFRQPPLQGPEADQKAFLDAAGAQYPRMANFSFDYGNAHWTVIDTNTYVDWRDPALRKWVADDLQSARGAAWRFVGFHHPGFNSSRAHFREQQARVLADVFEQGGVDIVFSGHVHNYQRSYPMRYKAARAPDGTIANGRGEVGGEWTLDKTFDGRKKTRPDGVIYIVTGAGGAGLYNPEQHDDPSSWQPFTTRFVSNTHSVTLVDVEGSRLTLRQVSAAGAEVDRIVIDKR